MRKTLMLAASLIALAAIPAHAQTASGGTVRGSASVSASGAWIVSPNGSISIGNAMGGANNVNGSLSTPSSSASAGASSATARSASVNGITTGAWAHSSNAGSFSGASPGQANFGISLNTGSISVR